MFANDTIKELHEAVKDGKLQDVTQMLAQGVNVEAADFFKIRPLHIAAWGGHLDIAKALMSRGCNVNVRSACPTLSQVQQHLEHFYAPDLALNLAEINFRRYAETAKYLESHYGASPLHLAAQRGHLSIVKALVSANASVNAEDDEKDTPLFSAVAHNFEDVAKFLIQNGAVVNARNSGRLTPLHFAARKGNVNIAKLLIQNKVRVNAKDLKGCTPLHVAVLYRQAATSQFLIDSGADVNARDNEGRTPLITGAKSGCPAQTVRLLIAKGASVNARDKTDRTPLHLAAERDYLDIVLILNENKADFNAIDERKWTPLHSAVYEGSLDVVKILLLAGACVNAKNHKQATPLHFAAAYRHVQIVEYLIFYGAEVNAVDHMYWTPLHFAADERSTHRDSGYSTAQAQDCKLSMMKALIENGADINAGGSTDETALHLAVMSGDSVVVRYLLDNGAYYDAQLSEISEDRMSEDVKTLLRVSEKLFKAVKRAKCAEIEKCVRQGAPINSRSIEHETPLMYACWKGHLDVVNVLINNGASIDLGNSGGVTPLHNAAQFGHHEILCTLLQHGAVYNARTKMDEKTPLHFAQEGGRKEVRETLELIERMFSRISKKYKTVLKELNELKNIKYAEFLAVKNCKNINKETLADIATKKGYEELCKLFYDL